MKICIVGPGIMPIPPVGWGAVEILIHDLRCELEKAGHEVVIVNVEKKEDIIQQVNEASADFVHIHYDDHISIAPYLDCKRVAVTSHCPYLESPNKWDTPYKEIVAQFLVTGVDVFALSPGISEVYKKLLNPSNPNIRLTNDKIHVVHNGVRTDLFRYSDSPTHPDRTLCLAKIEPRKRQANFQSIERLYFAGNLADDRFDATSDRYLGEWSKQDLYQNLTEYSNLMLLSDGEAHPLVCMEAMAAGLGLVLSRYAHGNLDLSMPFIDVIPESLMNDVGYVEKVLKENAAKSLAMREQIKEYAESFSWENVVKGKYMPAVNKILGRS